ncbi:MAG: T9SS type A sorting domain-containing protein [Prevotellaceae bacterium]|jgi:hypothetical protein|nr:T9SS type A sorting domain-containing protein [Prevotellaceae bacterium]
MDDAGNISDIPAGSGFPIRVTTGSGTVSTPKITDNRLSIYPNPVTDELKIENAEFNIGGKIEICDISGRIVLSIPTIAQTITVSQLPQGIYFIKIGDYKTKFIKK